MALPTRIAGEVRRLIGEQNISQADLARAVGVSQPAISRFLKTGSVSLPTLEKVCNALDVELVFSERDDCSESSGSDTFDSEENLPDGEGCNGEIENHESDNESSEPENATAVGSEAEEKLSGADD